MEALEIEKEVSEKVKLTVGFKCAAPVKKEIVDRSEKLGLTVSQYCENGIKFYLTHTPGVGEIVANPLSPLKDIEPVEPGVELSENAGEFIKIKVIEALDEVESMKRLELQQAKEKEKDEQNLILSLSEENAQLKAEKEQLQNTLKCYEQNETAKAIFESMQGKPHTYKNAKREEVTRTIENICDVYQVLIDSTEFEKAEE